MNVSSFTKRFGFLAVGGLLMQDLAGCTEQVRTALLTNIETTMLGLVQSFFDQFQSSATAQAVAETVSSMLA